MSQDKTMFYGASPEMFERAKVLRNHMTDSEQLLWNKLKDNQLNGIKFRRQHPISQFIVDFYCHQKKLVVELDGGIHQRNTQQERDMGRQFMLEELGLTVIRFKNEDIKKDISIVISRILEYCSI
ncbi:MAG TPA: endonuclease domain-containing protein [Bacteroidales bacterium]|nr:endonuclease domain-containing protein [Bacteroidales bacterium]